MNEVEKNRVLINKACKDTYDKYGVNQLVEAIKQITQNHNPGYFSGLDNRMNMQYIPVEEISKYILSTILTASVIKTKKGFAGLLAKTTNNIGEMTADDIEIVLNKQVANYGVQKTTNDVNNALKTNNVLGNKTIETFVYNRYAHQSINGKDFIEFEVNDPHVQEINNSIYQNSNYYSISVPNYK